MSDAEAHRALLAAVREHASTCHAETREAVVADVVSHIDALDEPVPVEPASLPVIDDWLGPAMDDAIDSTRRVVEALRRHHDTLVWSVPYGDVVGNPDIDHMRTMYSYALLACPGDEGAPTAPWVTDDLLLGFVLQGPGVMYPAHRHPAVEAYAVLGGTARWLRGDEDWTERPPGSVIVHDAHMRHATQTTNEPTLTWVAWTTEADCLPVLD